MYLHPSLDHWCLHHSHPNPFTHIIIFFFRAWYFADSDGSLQSSLATYLGSSFHQAGEKYIDDNTILLCILLLHFPNSLSYTALPSPAVQYLEPEWQHSSVYKLIHCQIKYSIGDSYSHSLAHHLPLHKECVKLSGLGCRCQL